MAKRKKKARLEVRITNPAGGCGWTSAKRAIKLVSSGRALLRPDLGDNVIEMIESDHRHLSAVATTSSQGSREAPHSVRLPAVLDSPTVRTSRLVTFGRYPMFPDEAFEAERDLQWSQLYPKAA